MTGINVAALVEPRDQARIPWPVVFAKAYALVAAGSPPLRRVYVKLPWPRLYELPQSVASIIIERDWPLAWSSGSVPIAGISSQPLHRAPPLPGATA